MFKFSNIMLLTSLLATKTSPVVSAGNCSSIINYLLSSISKQNESILKYDFVIAVNNTGDYWTSNYDSELVQVHIVTQSVFEGESRNVSQYPSIIIFPCLILSYFGQTLDEISLYYTNDLKARYWRPVFILVNPTIFQSESFVDDEIQNAVQNFSVDSDIYVMYQISGNANNVSSSKPGPYWLIKEYYSIRNQTITHTVAVLNFNQEIMFHDLIYRKTVRRSNFEKAFVIAVGADDLDYPLATKFIPGTLELESGFEVEIYNYFRDSLNFTAAAIKASGYIREAENGRLKGSAVQVQTEGDVSIGSAEFLEYRMKGPDGITYVHPIFYANVYAYFKQPPSSSVRNIFTQTFTTGLWLAALGLWIFIVLVMKLSVKLKRSRNKFNYPEDELIARDAVVWAASTICQQGWYMSPSSASIRIIFFFGIFTGLIMYVAYSAALVSILSVEVVPIQAFLDLLQENFFIVSDSHIPTAKFVVKGLEDSKQIPNLGEAVRNIEIDANMDKLIKTKLAIVTISDSFYPIVQQLNYTEEFVCKTISSKVVSSRPLKSSCVLRRGSPLRESFNYKMIQMHERGIREKLIKDYVLDTSIQCLQSGSIFHDELGLRDVFTAYIILLSGITLGLISVMVEKCVKLKLRK